MAISGPKMVLVPCKMVCVHINFIELVPNNTCTQDVEVARVDDFLELNRDGYELEGLSMEQQMIQNFPTLNICTRIIRQYKDEIHKKLKSDLVRIDKQRIPKIEGR